MRGRVWGVVAGGTGTLQQVTPPRPFEFDFFVWGWMSVLVSPLVDPANEFEEDLTDVGVSLDGHLQESDSTPLCPLLSTFLTHFSFGFEVKLVTH